MRKGSGGAEAGERVILTALESPINGMPVRTADDAAAADGDKLAVKGEEDAS